MRSVNSQAHNISRGVSNGFGDTDKLSRAGSSIVGGTRQQSIIHSTADT